MIKLTKLEPIAPWEILVYTDTTLETIIDLYDAVCDEQEDNGYDWEATKAKLLNDWRLDGWDVDDWRAYIEDALIEAVRDHVREKRAALSQAKETGE